MSGRSDLGVCARLGVPMAPRQGALVLLVLCSAAAAVPGKRSPPSALSSALFTPLQLGLHQPGKPRGARRRARWSQVGVGRARQACQRAAEAAPGAVCPAFERPLLPQRGPAGAATAAEADAGRSEAGCVEAVQRLERMPPPRYPLEPTALKSGGVALPAPFAATQVHQRIVLQCVTAEVLERRRFQP